MSDDELRDWQAHWQQTPVDVARAHARARRDDRRHRLIAIAEYAGMGVTLIASIAYAAWRGSTEAWWWVAALWTLGLPSLLFSWWNRRGLWRSAGLSAPAHLRLSLRRCRHGLRALRVGYGLLAASTGTVLLFAFGVFDARRAIDTWMLAWLAAFVGVHLLAMLLAHRHLRRRERTLVALLHACDADDDGDGDGV